MSDPEVTDSPRLPTSTGVFERPITVERSVLNAIRSMIVSRVLVPGSSIAHNTLASELGVSRTPVREALKILEGEGQVEYVPHRGFTVAELSLDDLLDIYRMRELLEAEAVSIALPRIEDHHLAVINTAMLEVEDPTADFSAIASANLRFHLALMEPCGKPQLLRVIRNLIEASAPYSNLYFLSDKTMAVVRNEHREIYRAVESRDVDAVVRALDSHRSIDRLRNVFEGR